MTLPSPDSAAVARRRAAVLLAHWTRRDHDGYHAVVEELHDEHEAHAVILALVQIGRELGEEAYGVRWAYYLRRATLRLAAVEVGIDSGDGGGPS